MKDITFLSDGRQLLFFSPAFVIAILTALLFLVTPMFAAGFTR